jgi:hypothetical protein
MKTQLIAKVVELTELLRACGWCDEAKWYDEKCHAIRTSTIRSEDFRKAAREINKSIFGMGSFTDMPLEFVGRKSSRLEVKAIQWRLAEDLSDLIDALLRPKRK